MLKKYLQTFKISWERTFVYRLNFFMWRLRTILWILTNYFFWITVYQNRDQIGNYTQSMMLTYILGILLLSELVMRGLSTNISGEISDGNLSNYLTKPINYFAYWLSRDWADKLLNLIFGAVEIGILLLIFKPPLIFVRNPLLLLVLFLVIFLSVILAFFLNLIVSLLAFWYPEHGGWPQRFLFDILFTFLMGMYFPLDILSANLGKILSFLPTGFLLYFPAQIYLGRITGPALAINIFLMLAWIFILYKVSNKIWLVGLKKYESVGR